MPVLTSNSSSLPEVAGEAALLVDPLNVSAMAREIERLTMDGDLRADLSRRGPRQAAKFSKENYRVRLAAAYKQVGFELENVEGGCKSPQREKNFEHPKISRSAPVAPYDLSR